MSLQTTSGMTIDGLEVQPNGPGLVQQLGNQVDEFYGKNVANAAALPASGKFAGQRIWLVDVKSHAVWDGSAWKYDTAWTTATLTSSWVAFGAPFDTPAYRSKNGKTEFRGVVKSGTLGNAILTLPTPLRPAGGKDKMLLTNADVGAARLQISGAGVLTVQAYLASGANGFVSLDSIVPFENAS
jgi:hypothetical protein